MKVNKSPILTSVNYGINDFELDKNLIKTCDKKFNNFNISNKNCVKMHKKCEKISKNGLNNPNFDILLEIEFNTEPIYLNFDFDQDNDYLVENLNIIVKENVDAKVVVRYISFVKSYHNGYIYTKLEKNSKLNIIVVNDADNCSVNLIDYENEVLDNAVLDYKIIDFAGDYSVQHFETNIIGENSTSNLKSLYFGKNEGKIDLNYVQNIFGKNNKTSIDCIGALDDNSTKNFKGTIDFKKCAKKSVGNENELCLMLSKNAKSKALPMLLCAEEDVDGSHSSAVGKIGDGELFYIMSRGLSKKEALQIYVKARFNFIIKDVFDDKLKQDILEKIDRNINNEN